MKTKVEIVIRTFDGDKIPRMPKDHPHSRMPWVKGLPGPCANDKEQND